MKCTERTLVVTTVRLCFAQTFTIDEIKKGIEMAFGFKMETNIQVYGNDGDIVIEEWSTDHDFDERNLIGRVRMSLQRFETICDCFLDELRKEANGTTD